MVTPEINSNSIFDIFNFEISSTQSMLIIFQFDPPLLAKDTNKLREFLQEKIDKRQKQIHPAHNSRFNHDLQLEIDQEVH